jgi:hypothetical protein
MTDEGNTTQGIAAAELERKRAEALRQLAELQEKLLGTTEELPQVPPEASSRMKLIFVAWGATTRVDAD